MSRVHKGRLSAHSLITSIRGARACEIFTQRVRIGDFSRPNTPPSERRAELLRARWPKTVDAMEHLRIGLSSLHYVISVQH
jgi:hypothetical protein